MHFLEQLSNLGIIKENQIQSIVKLADEKYAGSLDDALIEFGIDENTTLRLKGDFYSLPTKEVDKKTIPLEVLKYIPEDSAIHYKFIPLGLVDQVLEVGLLDPSNTESLDALQFISSKSNIPYRIFLIKKSDFDQLLTSYKGMSGQVEEELSKFDVDVSGDTNIEAIDEKILKPGEEEKIVEEAPIIKMVAVLLRTAVEGNASDIHIENVGEKVQVRFRVDGVLHTSLSLPLNVYSGVVARIKILSKLRLDEKRKPQDGGFSAKIENRKIDFRVSTLPTYYGEKVVLRILDSEKGVKKLENLGLSESNLAMIREALEKPYGLILVTGPTGSGKTTTLYSMLNELDRETDNIVSLEDPVEYHIPGVNQSQVMPEIGYTFASGLRSILRQDPDIIMVGEIRDKETAQLAIQAALTGHLVFSTLHTNDAIGAIPRLIDMGVDPYLIAPTLNLIIAQRLVRTLCDSSDAKKSIPIDEGIKDMIKNQFSDLPEEFRKKLEIKNEIYEGLKTAECPTGVRGRIAVYEMFKMDKDIEKIILGNNANENEIYKVARSKGMLSMREDAIIKSTQGIIPFEEVYSLSENE